MTSMPPTPAPYRQLLRPTTDRMIAGVASGLGRYFDVDPTLVRVIFAVAGLLTAGVALLAYPVLWFLMPEEPPDAPAWPHQPGRSDQPGWPHQTGWPHRTGAAPPWPAAAPPGAAPAPPTPPATPTPTPPATPTPRPPATPPTAVPPDTPPAA